MYVLRCAIPFGYGARSRRFTIFNCAARHGVKHDNDEEDEAGRGKKKSEKTEKKRMYRKELEEQRGFGTFCHPSDVCEMRRIMQARLTDEET